VTEQERQRLYSIAAVRGYRLFTSTVREGNGLRTYHYVAKLPQRLNGKPVRVSPNVPTKRIARRDLVRLILGETQRSSA